MIQICLLGPPRVERDSALVAFDTRKAVALLAVLVLADRPRPRDALADLLWPTGDREHARGALRRTLSSLRNTVGAELVEATSDHVRLVTGPGVTVDVDRFRGLCADRDWAGAVHTFRGDLLEGFVVRDAPAFEDWVQVEGDALRRQHLSALEALTTEQEHAGDLAGALTTARRWLSVDALHEPAHRALIRLYAATGDRAAALVQYRECVRALSRELGVPPLTETTELYEAVVGGSSPSILRVSAPPTALAERPEPSRTAPLVGRTDDLAALRSAYDGIGSDGRVAVVTGEPGIGKTRLAEELLAEVRGRGDRALVGRTFEDEAGLAYAPLADALRSRLRDGDDWPAGLDARTRSEVARLVPELGADLTAGSPPDPDAPGAEGRFMSAVWEALVAAAGGDRPGLLLLDDAQWADDATLGVLGYGMRRTAGRALLVVLTWRTPYDHAFRRVATTAARDGGVVLLLERLGRDDVAAMARGATPALPDPDVVQRLWERTEGVPLLVVEYLRNPPEAGEVLPAGVRDLLRGRLDLVSETGRQVLSAAAVLGRSFDGDTVRAVSGRTPDETVAALEEGVRRGLVVEGAFDHDFVHELLRQVVYDETGLARRRLLHGRVADVLGGSPASVARHLQQAGRDTEAAERYREAGQLARDVYANAEALDHLRAALALGHPDRTGLLIAIADLETLHGDYPQALATLESAAAECEPGQLTVVEQRLGRLQHRRGEFGLAAAHLEASVAACDDDPGRRTGITVDLSLAVHAGGDVPRARALAEEAQRLAEQAGDGRARCQAYNLLGMLATAAGDTDAALSSLGRSRELADRLDDQELRIAALNNLALTHGERNELEPAIGLTRSALELCTVTGDLHHEAALHNNLADLLHSSGRSEEAMAHLKTAVEILAEIGAEEEPRAGIWKLVQW